MELASLTQRVALLLQSRLWCSACGSARSSAAGSPGVWRRAALRGAPSRRRPQPELEPLWKMRACRRPLEPLPPWEFGPELREEKPRRMCSRAPCSVIPLSTKSDWSPGTAAGPGSPGLRPHASHLTSPHCLQPTLAPQSTKQQILRVSFWSKVLKLPRKVTLTHKIMIKRIKIKWTDNLFTREFRTAASSPSCERRLDSFSLCPGKTQAGCLQVIKSAPNKKKK